MLTSLLTLVVAREVAHVNSTLPFNYQHCLGDMCNGADQIAERGKCVEHRNYKAGTVFKKIGSGIKVTYFLRNRCEPYSKYSHVLDCAKADAEQTLTSEFPIQSYMVESCV